MDYTSILKQKPFSLELNQIAFISKKIDSMTIEEKIGQLFILVAGMDPQENISEIITKYQPGGFMYRPLPAKTIIAMHQLIQKESKIPAFLAANNEFGGDGLLTEGTHVGTNMQVGATNDSKFAYLQGNIAGKELKTVGGNINFAPVVDINFEWRNPITNIRSYGDKVSLVSEFARQNVLGMQEAKVAATIKHFPGDGVDSRDHHSVTAMNHFELASWDQSFGKVYRACYEAGALATMVGHFLTPTLLKDLKAPQSDWWIPSSYNHSTLNLLLRKHLNFNGLVITDSSLMAGMILPNMPRRKMLPLAIENGIDVLLFVRDLASDFASVLEGYHQKILSEKRLNEAVARILATKVKLNIFDDKVEKGINFAFSQNKDHQIVAEKVAQKSITLVKNDDQLFPLKAKQKILLIPFLTKSLMPNPKDPYPVLTSLLKHFKEHEIDVSVLDYSQNPFKSIFDAKLPVETIKEKYDAIIYVSDLQPMSNASNLLINWKGFSAADTPWLISDIKTGWISLGSPYHIFDAPQIRNLINAYSNKEQTITKLFAKIMGQENFTGVSPVNWDVAFPNWNAKK